MVDCEMVDCEMVNCEMAKISHLSSNNHLIEEFQLTSSQHENTSIDEMMGDER